jgi:hypothetical protein
LVYNEQNGLQVLKGEIIYVSYLPQERVTGPIPLKIRERFAAYEGLSNKPMEE